MTSVYLKLASFVTQLVKNLPAMQETRVRSLGWEDPLEKGKATHSSILAWRIPRTVYSPWGRKESDTSERLALTHLNLKFCLLRFCLQIQSHSEVLGSEGFNESIGQGLGVCVEGCLFPTAVMIPSCPLSARPRTQGDKKMQEHRASVKHARHMNFNHRLGCVSNSPGQKPGGGL